MKEKFLKRAAKVLALALVLTVTVSFTPQFAAPANAEGEWVLTLKGTSIDGKHTAGDKVLNVDDGQSLDNLLGTGMREQLYSHFAKNGYVPYKFNIHALDKELSQFESWEEVDNATKNEGSIKFHSNMTLYVPLAKTIDEVELTVDKPKCGEVSEVIKEDADLAPKVLGSYPMVSKYNEQIKPSGKTYDYMPGAVWLENETTALNDTIKGGKSYLAELAVVPAFGYQFAMDDNPTLTVAGANGDEVFPTKNYTDQKGNGWWDVRFIRFTIDAEHDWSEWAESKAPTCEEPGEESRECKKCGETETREGAAAIGHDWGEWTVIKEATETEKGSEERVCKNDASHKETREIPVKDHEHKLSKVEAKEATCTEPGNIDYWICSEGENPCGRYFADSKGTKEINIEDTVIDALGHEAANPVKENEKEATCTEDGSYDEVIYCTVCNEEISRETKTVDKLGHKYGAWEKFDAEQHQRVCEHDKSHVEKENHSWDAGKVTKEATVNEEGTKTYTCTVCQATKTESIPKLKPEPEPTPAPAKKVSGILLAKMATKGKTGLTMSWLKVKNVDGYDVFLSRCDHHGKKLKPKKVKTVKAGKALKFTKKRLKKGVAYKGYVKAYVMKNGKKSYVKKSPTVHLYTNGGNKKYTNSKKVTVKKAKVTLKKGKTFKIKASVKKQKKNRKLINHAAKLRYYSSNKKVATVSKKGKIKGKAKGTCKIYVLAISGSYKAVKVTVK